MKVQNISMISFIHGSFQHWGGTLIQICDPGTTHPDPPKDVHFDEVIRLSFFDAENSTGPSEQDALTIANVIKSKRNITVHCHAGLCRSGAVTEAAIAYGYEATRNPRIPNLRLKNQLFSLLNLGFNPNSSCFQ